MLKRTINFVFSLLGYVPASVVESLRVENEDLISGALLLKEEVDALVEENKSVWDLLDEMKGSSKIKKENVTNLLDELKDALTEEMLKDFKAVGEA